MALAKSNEFTRNGAVTGLFQCTTQYPTPFENVGLNILDDMREEFSGPVGLSDHSGSEYPSIAAIARGADMIEVHLCMNKTSLGQTQFLFDSEQFTRLKDARDCFHTMISNPVDKSLLAERTASTRFLFAQSLAPRRALTRGHKMSAEDFFNQKNPARVSWHQRLLHILAVNWHVTCRQKDYFASPTLYQMAPMNECNWFNKCPRAV